MRIHWHKAIFTFQAKHERNHQCQPTKTEQRFNVKRFDGCLSACLPSSVIIDGGVVCRALTPFPSPESSVDREPKRPSRIVLQNRSGTSTARWHSSNDSGAECRVRIDSRCRARFDSQTQRWMFIVGPASAPGPCVNAAAILAIER
eukprot:1810635-Rhodomonas_salina.1